MRELFPVLAAGVTPIVVLLLLILGASLNLVVWKPPILWQDHFGTAGLEISNSATAVALGDNGLYVAGYVDHSQLGSGASSTLFLRRYSLTGQVIWNKDIDTAPYDAINSLSVGAEGVYLSGTINATSFIRKYDFNGNLQWSQKWNGTIVSGRFGSLAAASGSLYVLVYEKSVFLRAFDSNGGMRWSDQLSNSSYLSVGPYASSQGVFLTDNDAIRDYAPNGTLVWTVSCKCPPSSISSLAGDATGIYVTASYGGIGFLSKYALNGSGLWTERFYSPDSSGVGNLQISAGAGGVFLGFDSGAGHAFAARYDSSGNNVWTSFLPSSINGIATGNDGVYIAGQLQRSGGSDVYVAKMALSSSLVFFGSNPPLSFGFLGIVVAIPILSILWLKTHRKKRIRAHRTLP